MIDIDFFFSNVLHSKKPEVYRLIKENVENSQWGAHIWVYSNGQSQFFSRPPSSNEESNNGNEMSTCFLL